MYSEDEWQARRQVKKGNIGERIGDRFIPEIAKEFLDGEGWIAYGPIMPGAHKHDRLFIHRDRDEQIPWDVKAKPKRDNYPDTGIDTYLLNRYLQQRVWSDFILIFIDEVEHRVYGNWLSELLTERIVDFAGWLYPSEYQGITYFPLAAMRTIAVLTDQDAQDLKQFRFSNHDAACDGEAA
jgi:hypothetical protein